LILARAFVGLPWRRWSAALTKDSICCRLVDPLWFVTTQDPVVGSLRFVTGAASCWGRCCDFKIITNSRRSKTVHDNGPVRYGLATLADLRCLTFLCNAFRKQFDGL